MQPVSLILTRPAKANIALRSAVPPDVRARVELVESPLVEIVPVKAADSGMTARAAIFTSANGVRFAPEGQGRLAFCVGEKTTAAANAAGWNAECFGQTAEALVQSLRQANLPDPTVHFCGVHVRGDIVADLASEKGDVRQFVVYDQRLLSLTPRARDVVSNQKPVIVPLFSPRTAAHFAAEAPGNPRLRTVCMSAAVAEKVQLDTRFEVLTAAEPTMKAMMHSIRQCLEDAAWVEGSDRQR